MQETRTRRAADSDANLQHANPLMPITLPATHLHAHNLSSLILLALVLTHPTLLVVR